MPTSKAKSLCCVGVVVFVGCWALPANRLLAQATAARPEQEAVLVEPTKSQLIDTLRKVFVLLEKEDYVTASQHFVLPPGFQPNMLDGFIQRSEISRAGIEVLDRDAKFGRAVDTFGAERAARHAERAEVDIERCYGFYHSTDEATGEVMAVWDGTNLKLLRLDDVGKLIPTSTAEAGQAEAGSDLMAHLANLDPEQVVDTPTLKPANDLAAIAARLPQLEAATTDNPLHVAARANYAMALYQLGNVPRAWTQLRVAAKLEPKHGGVAKGLSTVFARFTTMGVFTVGVPPETVTGLLGNPDEVVDLGTARERYVYSFYGIDFQEGRLHEVVDLRTATEAMFRPKEFVSADLDGRGWRCGSRTKGDSQVTAIYFLPGEMVSNWTEQVEVQRIVGAAGVGTIPKIIEKLVAQVKAVHPHMEYQILDTQDDSAIVALELPGKPEFPKRHQLVRLFRGPLDVHRLAYTIKVDQPTKQTQATWLAIMKAAKLEPVTE